MKRENKRNVKQQSNENQDNTIANILDMIPTHKHKEALNQLYKFTNESQSEPINKKRRTLQQPDYQPKISRTCNDFDFRSLFQNNFVGVEIIHYIMDFIPSLSPLTLGFTGLCNLANTTSKPSFETIIWSQPESITKQKLQSLLIHALYGKIKSTSSSDNNSAIVFCMFTRVRLSLENGISQKHIRLRNRLCTLISKIRNMTELDFAHCSIFEAKSVIHDMSNNIAVTTSGCYVPILFQLCSPYHQIQHLDLTATTMRNTQHIQNLGRIISNTKTLKSLYLSQNNLDPDAYILLLEKLLKNNTIENIALPQLLNEENIIHDIFSNNLNSLLVSSECNWKTVFVDLSNSMQFDQALCHALSLNRSITTLSLGSVTKKIIIEIFEKNTTIVKLSIASQLPGSCDKSLGKAIQFNDSIQELNLDSIHGYNSLCDIIEGISKNHHLKQVIIKKNIVSYGQGKTAQRQRFLETHGNRLANAFKHLLYNKQSQLQCLKLEWPMFPCESREIKFRNKADQIINTAINQQSHSHLRKYELKSFGDSMTKKQLILKSK